MYGRVRPPREIGIAGWASRDQPELCAGVGAEGEMADWGSEMVRSEKRNKAGSR